MLDNLFSLDRRVALVTGGNRGLGRAIALGFQQAGAQVAVTGRDPAKNAEIGRELGEDAAVFALEVRDEAAVAATVARVVERFGRLDILVNNAGIGPSGSVLSMSRAEWDAVVETNLTGMFLCAKHAAGAMIVGGLGGKIINMGSIYSQFGTPSFAGYGASKTGVLGLTRALAIELAVHNIQVNALLPGYCETDMTAWLPGSALGEEIRRRTPAGRWGRPEDLVGAAIFLASAASDYITGVQLLVDGGYSVTERFIHS